MLAELEREHPHVQETLLSALGNIETSRLLDVRYLSQDDPVEEPFPILTD